MVGALALAGIPILNGFWSKELILESGFAYGPLWAYLGMLASAGLTALYTARALRLVFFGQPQPQRVVHDAVRPMRVSLAILTVATATVWLIAGPLSELLASTPPVPPGPHGHARKHECRDLQRKLYLVGAGRHWSWRSDLLVGSVTARSLGKDAPADLGDDQRTWI